MLLCSLEFGFPPLTRVLPADEPDQVVHAGVGDGHHCHWMQLLLSRLHREVNVDLLCRRRANVTLKTRQEAQSGGASQRQTDRRGTDYLPVKLGVLIEGVVELLRTLLQAQRKGRLGA